MAENGARPARDRPEIGTGEIEKHIERARRLRAEPFGPLCARLFDWLRPAPRRRPTGEIFAAC